MERLFLFPDLLSLFYQGFTGGTDMLLHRHGHFIRQRHIFDSPVMRELFLIAGMNTLFKSWKLHRSDSLFSSLYSQFQEPIVRKPLSFIGDLIYPVLLSQI